MKSVRFWIVGSLLAATAFLLQVRGKSELIPASEPLSQLPGRVGAWTGRDVPVDPEELRALGHGEFLARMYSVPGASDPIGIFIAYFPSQRSGATLHSPRNCLPGAGWAFESSHYVGLKDAAGKSHQVGEYILARGGVRQFAIYWYQAHGRSVPNEYAAKFYLVADALRMRRTDGALVRVVTPVEGDEGIKGARARAEAFTAELFPALPRFIPE